MKTAWPSHETCPSCNGEGTTDAQGLPWREPGSAGQATPPPATTRSCVRCLGYGWRWSDGRPPTICPRNNEERLPCGRGAPKCSGCGRAREEIGLDEDVRVTAEERGIPR